MNKSVAIAALVGAAFANPNVGTNSFSRGVPPTTQNCNTYATTSTGAGDFNQQDQAWGLVVDREFGGCKCSAGEEAEFSPHLWQGKYEDNTWHCRCLNNDLYTDSP